MRDFCTFCGARFGHASDCPVIYGQAETLAEELIPAPKALDPAAYLRARTAGETNNYLTLDEYPNDGSSHIDRLDDGQIAEAVAEATGQEPPAPKPLLPTDSAARKNMPICTGVFDYFPRALAYVSMISKAGNEKHNPGQPLHWSKDKSTDHPDCIARHLIERGTRDPEDNLRHSGKLGWRALANLEIELEEAEKKGESW
jgi:hypothetical protein